MEEASQVKLDIPKDPHELMREAAAKAVKLSKAASQLKAFADGVGVRKDTHGYSIKLPSQIVVSGADYNAAEQAAVAFKKAMGLSVEKLKEYSAKILMEAASAINPDSNV